MRDRVRERFQFLVDSLDLGVSPQDLRLGSLPLGDVAQDAREEHPFAGSPAGKGDFDREFRAILFYPIPFHSPAADPCLARPQDPLTSFSLACTIPSRQR